MHRTLAVVGCIVMMQAVVAAQGTEPIIQPETGQTHFICPLDGFAFNWPDLQPSGSNRGIDSDMCPYPTGVFPYGQNIVTCPHCNYTDIRTRFATDTLTNPMKDKLLQVLAGSTYRGVQDSYLMIPTWERCRLGMLCAKARGLKVSESIDFPLVAIYSIRFESTRLASTSQQFGDPLRDHIYLARVERKMTEAKDPGERARLKLELAMLAQRMGLPQVRERWLTAASADPGATPALKTAIENFRAMTKLETSFQKDMLTLLDEARADTDLAAERRMSLTYLKADTLRRLGDLKQAAQLFHDLRSTMTEISPRRDMVDYFTALLRDHLPEQVEEKEKK